MSLSSRVLSSAWFATSSKLVGKALGLLSTLLLARILSPADFGYIAAISIALYFFDVLANAASEMYIIRKRKLRFSELQTAWTFNLVLKLLISIIVIFLAPFIAQFLDKPEIEMAIRFSALVLPITALKSASLMLLKRHLIYQGIFWLAFVEKMFSFVTVVSLAVLLKNFWAFVIADVVAAIAGVFFSYYWFRGFKGFGLSELTNQLQFSSWMLGKSIVGYVRSQIDTVMISRHFDAGDLGSYHLSREVAMLPGHYLLAPAIEPLLSAFRETRDDNAEFINNTAFCTIVVFLVGLPITFFLSFYSRDIILLLLGEQWSNSAPLLSILSWLMLYWSVMHVAETALVAKGKIKSLFAFDCIALLSILTGLLWIFSTSYSLESVAMTRLLIGASCAFGLVVYVFSSSLKELAIIIKWALLALFGALSATFISMHLVNLLPTITDSSLLSSLFECSIGAVVFFSVYGLVLTGILVTQRDAHGQRIRYLVDSLLS